MIPTGWNPTPNFDALAAELGLPDLLAHPPEPAPEMVNRVHGPQRAVPASGAQGAVRPDLHPGEEAYPLTQVQAAGVTEDDEPTETLPQVGP